MVKAIKLLILLTILVSSTSWAAPIFVLPKATLLDDSGDICTSCEVEFYEVGTSTPKEVYSDSTLDTSAGSSLTSNSAGRIAVTYFDGAYKIIVKDSDGTTLYTADNLRGMGAYVLGFAMLSDYTSLSNAVSTISTTETTLYIDTDDTMAGDITCPATLSMIGMPGNTITLGTYALTINGPFSTQGHNSQVFNENSTGVVAFGTKAVSEINCAWWGLNGDATALDGTGTDDSDALQSCIDCGKASTNSYVIPAGAGYSFNLLGVSIPSGAYLCNSGLWLGGADALNQMRGDAGGQTTLYFETTDHALDLVQAYSTKISDITIIGDATSVPKTGMLLARESAGASAGKHSFTNVNIYGSFSVSSVYNYASEENYWFNCEISNNVGYAAFIQTYNNAHAAYGSQASANATIDTGSQSNFGGKWHGCRIDYRRTTSGDSDMAAVILETVSYGPKFYGVYFNLGSADDCPMVRIRYATGTTTASVGQVFDGCTFHAGATSYICIENTVKSLRVVGCNFSGSDANVTDAAIYATDDGTYGTIIQDSWIEAPEVNFKDGRVSNNIDCRNCEVRIIDAGNPGISRSFSVYRQFEGDLYLESGDTLEYDSDYFNGCIHETDTGLKKCWQALDDGTVGRKAIDDTDSPYSATGYEETIYVDADDGAVIITLPVITHYLVGRELMIVFSSDSSGNNATVNTGAANYFDDPHGPRGAAASTSAVATGDSAGQMESILIRAKKNNRWQVISNVGWMMSARTLSVADDAATSWNVSNADTGLLHVGIAGSTGFSGVVMYDTATPTTVKVGGGADFNVSTGLLAGTTGTDAKVTVSAHTDGKVYIENRSGAAVVFYVKVLHDFY